MKTFKRKKKHLREIKYLKFYFIALSWINKWNKLIFNLMFKIYASALNNVNLRLVLFNV